MDSDESKVDEGSTKFRFSDLLKKIVVLYLTLLSNLYKKLEDFLKRIHVFVDEKVDKYAPSFVKSLHDNINSQIDEHIPSVQKAFAPIADKTKSLVGGIPILGNVLGDVKHSITHPTDAAHDLIDRTASLVTDNPLSQAVNSAASQMMQEAQRAGKKAALKSVYASLTLLAVPLIAEGWYKANTKEWFSKLAKLILPLIEKLCNWYNNMVDKMEKKGYSFFGYLPTVPITEIETAYKLVKAKNDGLAAVGGGLAAVGGGLAEAGEEASDLVGSIPIVGGVANAVNQTADAAHQLVDNTASLITDNPLSQAVQGVAGQMVQGTQALATKAALKSVYTSLTLLLCPAIAEFCYKLRAYALIKALGKAILPLIEELCEWYNEKLKELDEKGHSFFGYLPTIPITEMKAAYKLVKTANAGLEAVGDGVSAGGGVAGLNNDDE